MKNKRQYLLIALLALTALVYWPLTSNRFIYWDDYFQFLGNPAFHQITWAGLLAIFRPDNNPLGMYQPLATAIFTATYQLFGPSPLPFHLLSLLFHLLNILLVFWLLNKLSRRFWPSFITSAFFALHPVQVESVAWISAFSNLLWSSAALSAMIIYLYHLKQPKKWQLALIYLLTIGGLLAKFAAAVIPVYLYLLDWLKGRWSSRLFWQKIFLLIIAFFFGLLAVTIRQSSHGHPLDMPAYTFVDTLWLSAAAPVLHLSKVVWPVGLNNFYPYPAKTPYLPWWIYASAITTIILLSAILLSKRKSLIAGAVFYIISLALIFKIVPSSTPIMADRYLYLAALPVYWLAAEGLLALHRWRKYAAITVTVIVFGVLGYLSYAQTKTWFNDYTVWQRVVDLTDSARSHALVGKTYMIVGDYTQALYHYQRTVALNPGDSVTWNNIAVMEGDLYGRWQQSLAASQKALSIDAESQFNWYRTGLAEAKLGQNQKALNHFNQAIVIEPDFAEAYYEKALLLEKIKKHKEACRNLAKARDLDYNEAKKLYTTLCRQ